MTDDQITLENWVTEVSQGKKGNELQLIRKFQENWYEGHRANPALYPLNRPSAYWQDQWEWFDTVEKYALPSVGPSPASGVAPDKTARAPKARPRPSADAPTVLFDASTAEAPAVGPTGERKPVPDQAATVMYDHSRDMLQTLVAEDITVEPEGSPAQAADLSDLEVESLALNQEGTVIIDAVATRDDSPADDLEDLASLLIESDSEDSEPLPQPPVKVQPEPADRDPVIVDGPPAAHDRAEDDFGDLGTLIMANETNTEKPPNALKKPKVREKEAPAPKAPARGKTASPQPGKPVKKDRPSDELELDDLDTLEWMKE